MIWVDSAYHVHGIGGTSGNMDAGNLFFYDDCCVWAIATKGIWNRLAHDGKQERIAIGEEQAKLAPEELIAQDRRNWTVERSRIMKAYLWDGEGTVGQGGGGERTVYYVALRMDLDDDSHARFEWRFSTARERQEWKVPRMFKWFGELIQEAAPPKESLRDKLDHLRHRT